MQELEQTNTQEGIVDSKFDYFISKNLRTHWEKYSLAYMKKVNRDRVIIVDGTEGVGKSLWTIQQAAALDKDMFSTPKNFISRIAFSPEEFFDIVRKTKNGVVIFDEAFRGFSSRSALSKVNKKLVSVLMEMRQNNNIVFIVLPSFFLLDLYPAMLRSNSLFNIYFDPKSGKRAWRGFNKRDKNAIYQKGAKKSWTYTINTMFKGNFYSKFPGGDEYKEAYEKKKSQALVTLANSFDGGDKDKEESIFNLEQQHVLFKTALYLAGGQKPLAKMVEETAFKEKLMADGFSPTNLARYIRKFEGKDEKEAP